MPRLKRIRRKHTHRLEIDHIDELLTGKDFFGDAFGDDEAWRRSTWEGNRNAIMAYCENPNPHSWVGRLCGSNETANWEPGTKPWAWHRYDNGEGNEQD